MREMDKPLEIAFHGVEASEQVEDQIRERMEKLERRFGHLTGCRVIAPPPIKFPVLCWWQVRPKI
jgi:hypothetical protein